MAPPKIAIINCRELPEPDPDHAPLERRLSELGAEVQTVAWDGDPSQRATFDLGILRATWNYYHFPEQFLDWCRRVSSETILLNPYAVVAWNCNKRYLGDLAARRVPIVPTVFLERNCDPQELLAIWQERGWDRIVLKPQISAASFQTESFSPDQSGAALDFLTRQLGVRAMMVQPWIASTHVSGEKSIAWIDGAITHAWIKHPRFAGQDERVEPTESLTAADRALVTAVLTETMRREIFYARIDVMYDEAGQPLLSELELIEPSLQFRFSDSALERFAQGLLRIARMAG